MPKEINFIVPLSSDLKDRIRVIAIQEKGRIIRFVAQYESFIMDAWREVVRYDTAHGFAHKDIIHPNGSAEKQPLKFADFNTAFTFAVQDLKIAWKWYRKAYEEEIE
ncbi:MAG: hypothetical protein HY265_02790 [Deltaproteobacteria bacterium]|nr:hypothetical protein [Deltaproteobacteria bacterium]